VKVFLLLEPPFSTISLELEDVAETKKYSYFSLSDVYMSEAEGGSAIAKTIAEAKAKGETLLADFTYRLIVEKYLHKAPKNKPNGFVLDPDCIGSAAEFDILMEVLEKAGHEIIVIDIQTPAEECAEYIEDFGVDEAEGMQEIAEYFDTFYPTIWSKITEKGLRTEIFSSEEDSIATLNWFSVML
jgi:hypothetical protein